MFAFKIASRFLSYSKAQTFLIMLGIAIGVSVQVFIGSLIQGLQNSLLDATVGSSSHITVLPSERNTLLDNDNEIYQLLNNFDKDIKVVNRVLEYPGNILTDDQSDPVILRGFNYQDANIIYKLDERIIEGRFPENDNEIVIGKDLLETLNLSINDEIDVFLPGDFSNHTLTITGVFDFGVAQVNQTWLITSLEVTQALIDVEGISKYEIQINDVFNSKTLKETLESELSNTYRITEWQSANQELLSGLQGQSTSSLMIQVFVIISVVLGISSVLAITVLQKSKQLGILKAMGITDKQASLIFLYQGLLLGVFGAILGILIGIGLAFSFTIFAVNPDGTPILELYIDPLFIMFSGLIAIVASLIASFIPAKRSARLSVIEVIRNG